MSNTDHQPAGHHGAPDAHDHHGPDKGWRRWLLATNHKDIGTMYLLFSLLMFFVGGGMAMVIRGELFQPGRQLVDPMFFNSMTTMPALIMIFGAVMPAFVGLANWMIPLQIGAPDMATMGVVFTQMAYAMEDRGDPAAMLRYLEPAARLSSNPALKAARDELRATLGGPGLQESAKTK